MRLIVRLDSRLAPAPEGETPAVVPLVAPIVVQFDVSPEEFAQVVRGDGVTVVLRGEVQAKF